MKVQINEKLFEYYKELFNAEWQGEKVWKQIRDKKLTIAPCFKGDLYDNSNVQLMVVGRAVNGWEHDFQNCIDAETTTKIALNQNFNFDDVTNQEGFISATEPNKKPYKYENSNLWRLIKYILEAYDESDCSINDNTWYSDTKKWNHKIIWSNLYKIAPYSGGNPDWQFFKPHMQTYIDIVKEEINIHQPKCVLFVTNSDYFDPWKRQPSFAKEFGIQMPTEPVKNYIVAKGIYNGTKMIVCKRPDVFGISHEDIRKMANEIKTTFENLE